MAEANFTADELLHKEEDEVDPAAAKSPFSDAKIEEKKFDIPFDLARTVIFSKRLEELLKYVLAAVASDNIDYLDYIGKEFNKNEEGIVWDGNKAYEGFKTLLELDPSGSFTRETYSGLWNDTDTNFRRILVAAVKQLGPRYREVRNHDCHDRQSAENDQFLRRVTSGINSTDEAVKLIEIIRKHDSVASRILRRNLAFELIRPLNLTLGSLIYESMSNPWPAVDGHGQNKRRQDSVYDEVSRKAVKQFIDSKVVNDGERTAIKADLLAINDLRKDLVHFSKKYELTPNERERLETGYSSIVSSRIFKLIFEDEESKGKKHKFTRMKSFQNVTKLTEWKAVIEHYKRKMEQADMLADENKKLQDQLEVIIDELKETEVTIEGLGGEAYMLEQRREAAMLEKEEVMEVNKNLQLEIASLQYQLRQLSFETDADEVNRLQAQIEEKEREKQELRRKVESLEGDVYFTEQQRDDAIENLRNAEVENAERELKIQSLSRENASLRDEALDRQSEIESLKSLVTAKETEIADLKINL